MSIPVHGNPSRYKRYGCRCTSCSNAVNRGTVHKGPPSWPIKYLFNKVSIEVVRDDFGDEFIEDCTINGIEDFKADELCTFYGLWTGAVWPGWIEAGLDFYGEEPQDD